MLYSCRETIAGAFPVGALPYNRSGAVPASEPLRRRRARASWRMTTPPGFPPVSFKSGRLERWLVQRLPQRRRAWINVQHTIPANMNRLFAFALAFFALVGYISCAATGETDCQRRRREEQESTAHRANLLIPECDEHGDYKALQCFGEAVQGKPFCACYDKEFGQIKGPSKNIASCNCVRAHHEWEHSTDENKGSEPKCNATSGAYDQIQCDTNEHWCVDWDTGAQLGLKMNGGCSTDLSGMTCGTGGNHHGHSDGHHGESAHHHGASHDHSGAGSDGTSHHDDHGHHGDAGHH